MENTGMKRDSSQRSTGTVTASSSDMGGRPREEEDLRYWESFRSDNNGRLGQSASVPSVVVTQASPTKKDDIINFGTREESFAEDIPSPNVRPGHQLRGSEEEEDAELKDVVTGTKSPRGRRESMAEGRQNPLSSMYTDNSGEGDSSTKPSGGGGGGGKQPPPPGPPHHQHIGGGTAGGAMEGTLPSTLKISFDERQLQELEDQRKQQQQQTSAAPKAESTGTTRRELSDENTGGSQQATPKRDASYLSGNASEERRSSLLEVTAPTLENTSFAILDMAKELKKLNSAIGFDRNDDEDGGDSRPQSDEGRKSESPAERTTSTLDVYSIIKRYDIEDELSIEVSLLKRAMHSQQFTAEQKALVLGDPPTTAHRIWVSDVVQRLEWYLIVHKQETKEVLEKLSNVPDSIVRGGIPLGSYTSKRMQQVLSNYRRYLADNWIRLIWDSVHLFSIGMFVGAIWLVNLANARYDPLWLLILNIVFTLFWGADFILTTQVAVQNDQGRIVIGWRQVGLLRRKDLSIDSVGLLPVDFILQGVAMGTGGVEHQDIFESGLGIAFFAFRIIKTIKLLTVNRLFPIVNENVITPASVNFHFRYKPVVVGTFWLCFFIHLCTVGHQLVIRYEKDLYDPASLFPNTTGGNSSSTTEGHEGILKRIYPNYSDSLLWVCILLSGSSASVEVHGIADNLFALPLICAAVLLQGLLVGKLGSFVFHSTVSSENNQLMLDTLSIVRHYKVPLPIQREILSYQMHVLNDDVGRHSSNLEALPLRMQDEILTYIKVDAVSKVKIFGTASEQCKMKLAFSLEKVIAEPDSEIVTCGDTGTEMFLIAHGYADVIIGSGLIVATFTRGDYFGEMALVTPECKRSATIQALTFCDLWALEKEQFLEALGEFPDFFNSFKEVMKERNVNLAHLTTAVEEAKRKRQDYKELWDVEHAPTPVGSEGDRTPPLEDGNRSPVEMELEERGSPREQQPRQGQAQALVEPRQLSGRGTFRRGSAAAGGSVAPPRGLAGRWGRARRQSDAMGIGGGSGGGGGGGGRWHARREIASKKQARQTSSAEKSALQERLSRSDLGKPDHSHGPATGTAPALGGGPERNIRTGGQGGGGRRGTADVLANPPPTSLVDLRQNVFRQPQFSLDPGGDRQTPAHDEIIEEAASALKALRKKMKLLKRSVVGSELAAGNTSFTGSMLPPGQSPLVGNNSGNDSFTTLPKKEPESPAVPGGNVSSSERISVPSATPPAPSLSVTALQRHGSGGRSQGTNGTPQHPFFADAMPQQEVPHQPVPMEQSTAGTASSRYSLAESIDPGTETMAGGGGSRRTTVASSSTVSSTGVDEMLNHCDGGLVQVRAVVEEEEAIVDDEDEDELLSAVDEADNASRNSLEDDADADRKGRI